jgi:hypothetical protein
MLRPSRESSLMQSTNYILSFLLLVLALSYFYQVPQNPPGFYIDEASIDAYTIASTRSDCRLLLKSINYIVYLSGR